MTATFAKVQVQKIVSVLSVKRSIPLTISNRKNKTSSEIITNYNPPIILENDINYEVALFWFSTFNLIRYSM